MNRDLAFCLERFIDEQVNLIDKKYDEIQKIESEKEQEVQEQSRQYEERRPPAKNKGTHDEDKAFIDRFIRDLREAEEKGADRLVIEDPAALASLRAEIDTKIGASQNYVNRIRALAQPMPNTKKFVEACQAAIQHLRRTDLLEENFEKLFRLLKDADENTLVKTIQAWWKEAYGTMIANLNEQNKKFNRPITEDSFATVSPTSRIVSNGKTLLTARKIVSGESKTIEVIRQFVNRLLDIDEDERNKNDSESLIEQLSKGNVEDAVEYARRWLKRRDDIRSIKEENPCKSWLEKLASHIKHPLLLVEQKLVDIKAEYGRQRLAQGAKKLALAALMRRLAVGSDNDEQFDEQLRRTIESQSRKDPNAIPIISGQIPRVDVERLPFIVRLISCGPDLQKWVNNEDNIQEKCISDLCRAFGIPNKAISIERIDTDDQDLFFKAAPPYGKKVIDSLNGNAPDAAARMEQVRECLKQRGLNVKSITLGDFDLKVEDRLMDPTWNKIYRWPDESTGNGDYWSKPLIRGGKPYYCPSGWHRFGVKVAENGEEFDSKWGNWYIAYHGTQGENATSILTSGLKVSTQGCFYEEGTPRVYVSPSIEYSAHPRYAWPWRKVDKDGRTMWYQLVFQCRVNPESVSRVGPETLIHTGMKGQVTVDPNFENGELEWVVIGKNGTQFIKDDIICYGIMMRYSPIDPDQLPASHWWKHAHHSDSYKR